MAEQHAIGPFLGRDRELAELLTALEDAEQGRGRLFLVSGEPGIGKSRLADELTTRARQRGHLVLWGRGWEDAGAPPYWPWVQVMRAYVRLTPPEVVRRQMGAGARDVAQMMPEIRDLFDDLTTPSGTDSDATRFQLFDSATSFLRNAAADRPLVVVTDDLQAADTPSIRYLRFVASQLADMRLLLLGTYRDVELTPEHPLTAAIDELAREPITRRMSLTGLDSDALRRLITAAVGTVPDEHTVAAIARGTRGNPLYVGETVRLLSAEGRLDELSTGPAQRLPVPAGVRAVIGRRLARLSDATRRLLSIGATAGPEFGVDLLRATADLEAADLIESTDQAVAEGILVPVTGAVGRYRFSHDLVRETLYDELAPGQRMRLHRRVAEALERQQAAAGTGHLAELAHHWYQAAQDDEAANKAIAYARLAAEEAVRSLAFEEAARLYGIARRALERDGPSSDDPARLEILLAQGDAFARGGDLPGSRATLFEAAELAKRLGAAPELARAALGIGGRLPWARPGRETMIIPLLQDALVHLGGADDRLRVRLLSRLACAWRSTPEEMPQSDSLTRQAVELARSLGDPSTLSYALAGRFWATWWPHNPESRLTIAREMILIAEASGDGERVIDGHLMLCMSYTELGDMASAHRESEEVRRLGVELRQPAHHWLGVVQPVLMALLEGDFASAERLGVEEAGAFDLTTARDNVSAARFHRFLLRREQGRLAEEEAAVRSSVEEFPWYPVHRCALACLLADLGRSAEAQAVLGQLATDDFSALYPDNEWLLGAALAADASAVLGDRRASETLYAQLLPFAGRHAIGQAEGSVGSIDRYLGLLAATLGRLDDAVRHLEAAITLNTRMGARPWTAHSEHDLARVLRRRDQPGDRDRAEALEAMASVTAQTLGMPALAASIAADGKPGLDSPAPPQAGAAVFRRDGEIWALRFGGEECRIRDAKGMAYLARLLGCPGQEVHALDLATAATATRAPTGALTELSAAPESDAGRILDDEAKAAYRRRANELRAELAQAEEWNDGERVAALSAELEFLEEEIAAAVGLGGRDRRAASAAERARISVTRAIHTALARIGAQSPSLGRHLAATVKTGTYCSYNPDPRVPIRWER